MIKTSNHSLQRTGLTAPLDYTLSVIGVNSLGKLLVFI